MTPSRPDTSALRILAVASALFSLVLAGLLVMNQQQREALDPVLSEEAKAIDQLAAQHLANPGDETLRAEILQRDQALRQQYFDRAALARAGVLLLLGGLLTFVLTVRRLTTQSVEVPEGEVADDRVAARLVLALAVLFMLGTVTLFALQQSRATAIAQPPTDDPTAGPDISTGGGSPTVDETAPYWPGWRGPGGAGVSEMADLPTAWNQGRGDGIAWKVEIPLGGRSAPIIHGTRVIASGASGTEQKLFAFDLRTGELLWAGEKPIDPAAPALPASAASDGEVDYATPTPTTDGKQVYVLYNNGEVAAFDIASGELVWMQAVGQTHRSKTGIVSSPVLVGSRLVVPLDDEVGRLYAFDTETGALRWMRSRDGVSEATPAVLQSPDGPARLVLHDRGSISAWNPPDGRRLWGLSVPGGAVTTSPVVRGARVYAVGADGSAFAIGVQDSPPDELLWQTPAIGEGVRVNSPVVVDGLLYRHVDGVLYCSDAETGEAVFGRPTEGITDHAWLAASTDCLFVVGKIASRVYKLGREAEELGAGTVSEPVVNGPALAPGRIVLRSRGGLIGVGQP